MELPPFEDPQVQLIYKILVEDEVPPNPEEHWEGWVAKKIVAAQHSVFSEKSQLIRELVIELMFYAVEDEYDRSDGTISTTNRAVAMNKAAKLLIEILRLKMI